MIPLFKTEKKSFWGNNDTNNNDVYFVAIVKYVSSFVAKALL